MPSPSESLASQAEKLANGKTGHSPTPKPGFLAHTSGRWRDPKLHEQIVSLYQQSAAAEEAEGVKLGFARYRLGLEHLYVGDTAKAREQLEVLRARGSSYAGGSFPIWLALAEGDKALAKRELEALNQVNAQKGRPKQKLSDFEF